MQGFNEKDFHRSMVMFLDGALSKDESREFLENIKHSPDFLDRLQKEKSFRETLRKKAGQRTVSPSVVQIIKSKISDKPSYY